MRTLPTFFPFYSDIDEQEHRRENAKTVCGRPAITYPNMLLPFQFVKETDSPIAEIKLYKPCDQTNYIDLFNPTVLGLIKCAQTENGFYVYYNGEPLSFQDYASNILPLNMGITDYYVYIRFADGQEVFSEVFRVYPENYKLLKITVWNDTDIFPIKYQDIGFKQAIYLDTYLHRSESEIEEENERDGNGEAIPTFQKIIVDNVAEVLAQDGLKNSLVAIEMHDHVEVKDGDFPSFIAQDVETSSSPDDTGALSVVEMKFQRLTMVKTACNNNIETEFVNIW